MTARVRVLSAAVLRAGLLAAVLSIVAGIFGMHVITAGHSSHAGHAGTAAPAAAPASAAHPAGHTAVGHSHAGHIAAPGNAAEPFPALESCGAGCPDVREAGAYCIPLGKTGPLATVPPPINLAVHLESAGGTQETSGYSYIPASPTPGELSISRT
ncbi:hypothetical protein [Pseudarthrobacter sp. NamE5]|uniref:hypothetical protein n=1 Tax=Pseudarthrobacter sp. NamE5 TaxID=2576839 RepID=UPI00110BF3F2|nr:hypothetical protein [Pseudarthrobacter sp. NamE5]TLM84677.1 hypothetical protein FDW84_11200 [Pseudarthrobacter sp. NamE5]